MSRPCGRFFRSQSGVLNPLTQEAQLYKHLILSILMGCLLIVPSAANAHSDSNGHYQCTLDGDISTSFDIEADIDCLVGPHIVNQGPTRTSATNTFGTLAGTYSCINQVADLIISMNEGGTYSMQFSGMAPTYYVGGSINAAGNLLLALFHGRGEVAFTSPARHSHYIHGRNFGWMLGEYMGEMKLTSADGSDLCDSSPSGGAVSGEFEFEMWGSGFSSY